VAVIPPVLPVLAAVLLLYHIIRSTKMKKLFTIFLLVFSFSELNAVDLTIRYRDGSTRVFQYDDNTEKLAFRYGVEIVAIEGIEQLSDLKEIRFEMTSYISDFSFLRSLSSVEVLRFETMFIPDISFIYEMASLRRLILQGFRTDNVMIDASRLPNLEYFEFTNSQLTEFPLAITKRQKIDTINVAFNRISNIPIDESMGILVMAVGNPIISFDNRNIITGTGDIFHLLPEEYRQYVK
jgi:hypothetical protein